MKVKWKVKNVLCKIWCPLWNKISGGQMHDNDFLKNPTPPPPHPSTDKFLPNNSDYYESFFSASVAYFTLLVV